jgi:hypothetical protein
MTALAQPGSLRNRASIRPLPLRVSARISRVRRTRDAHFLLGLERSGPAFTAADMPDANRLTVGITAMVVEEERRAISERTKMALVRLGGRPESLKNTELGRQRATEARRAKAAARAENLVPVTEAIRAQGITSAIGHRERAQRAGNSDCSRRQIAGRASTASPKHLKGSLKCLNDKDAPYADIVLVTARQGVSERENAE